MSTALKNSTALLRVINLHTSFFVRRGVVRAVDGVSFDIERGEMLGVVGESGCGKSITGLSIMRLVPFPGRILEGEILFDDRDLFSLSENEIRQIRGSRIAMIFQDPMTSLNPVLTISRQLTESLKTHTPCSSGEARAKAVELLKRVGIPSPEKRINDYPHQFSGGMRQRVMIAMAISCSPELLIADEPTTALDVTIQAQILELMKKICEDLGASIMLITHDLGIVAGLCQRVVVMYAGQIVENAQVKEIYAKPKHPYTHGLLTSTPRMDRGEKRLQSIGGLPPSLLNPPVRCLFAPRCSFAQDICRKTRPALKEVSEGHFAACFRKDESLW